MPDSDRNSSCRDMIGQTQHRTFKVRYLSPIGNVTKIEIVSRREVQLGTQSDYGIDRGGCRDWKCDEGIRAAMWNQTANLSRMSNILSPVTARMPPHIEDDCVMLLLETIVQCGWADQVMPLLLENFRLDVMNILRLSRKLGETGLSDLWRERGEAIQIPIGHLPQRQTISTLSKAITEK